MIHGVCCSSCISLFTRYFAAYTYISVVFFDTVYISLGSWDEFVPESRVLKYNEAGLQKQKELMKAHGYGAHACVCVCMCVMFCCW